MPTERQLFIEISKLAAERDALKEALAVAVKALNYVLSHGQVSEGEGVWLGHSGQIEVEKALAAIARAGGGEQ